MYFDQDKRKDEDLSVPARIQMTSQIVLINQEGIAIASDTMSSWEVGDRIAARQLASKIIEIGNGHRVAVMLNGLSAIDNVHTRTLVREWARQVASPFPTLFDYVEDFEHWLVGALEGIHLSQPRMLKMVIRNEFDNFLRWEFIDRRKGDLVGIEGKGEIGGVGAKDIGVDELDALVDALKAYQSENITSERVPKYPDLNIRKAGRLMKSAGVDPTQIFVNAVSEQLQISIEFEPAAKVRKTLHDFCSNLLTRKTRTDEFAPYAQLNFVGFGTNELMGGLVSIDVRSLYAGRLRGVISERQPADPEYMGASVFPLAQKRAMNFVPDGLDEVTANAVREAVACVLNAGETSGEKSVEEVGALVVEHLRETRQERIGRPVRYRLSGMGLSSLVDFAAALVQMESLRSAATKQTPTVGGPIEVISISRWQEPGVQWRRRPQVNPSSSEP